MLLFGHTGITLGAAVLLTNTLARSYPVQPRVNKVMECPESTSKMHSAQSDPSPGRARWFTSLGNHIDIRLLFVGSLLPDIIDKPVGTLLFRDSLSNGRVFCHTLAFLLLITLVGLYLHRNHGKTWMLTLSFGTFTHLLCDRMWLELRTLLWPLYGFAFEKIILTHWLQDTLRALHTDPAVYVPEMVGAAILVWFAVVVAGRRKVSVFIKYGQM